MSSIVDGREWTGVSSVVCFDLPATDGPELTGVWTIGGAELRDAPADGERGITSALAAAGESAGEYEAIAAE